jgi:hypothetical protein
MLICRISSVCVCGWVFIVFVTNAACTRVTQNCPVSILLVSRPIETGPCGYRLRLCVILMSDLVTRQHEFMLVHTCYYVIYVNSVDFRAVDR